MRKQDRYLEFSEKFSLIAYKYVDFRTFHTDLLHFHVNIYKNFRVVLSKARSWSLP